VIFDWDDHKEAANIKKHGVDFWEAQTVFYDPLIQTYADSGPGEDRFILIGQSSRPRLLLVVYAEFDGDQVRIISAREPTPAERRAYEERV
jgi:uncharacterized DUF497 family protein